MWYGIWLLTADESLAVRSHSLIQVALLPPAQPPIQPLSITLFNSLFDCPPASTLAGSGGGS